MSDPLRLTVLADHWPALTETFVVNEVVALQRRGEAVHVETAKWARRPGEPVEPVPVDCIDDDGQARRLLDLAWLVARHPAGCLRDLRDRRRWSREETVRPLRVLAPQIRRIAVRRTQHLHAHFAGGVALDALRIGRLLGLGYSVMAHAFEIYQHPRNLPEKLRAAVFAAGECEYSVGDLRDIAGPGHDVHVITMGVDHARFRRTRPQPDGRSVLAVGRLIEKKGFTHLLTAASRMRLDRLVMIGDGPLREPLEAQAAELGLEQLVEWRGAQGPDEIRAALEEAGALAVSAVHVPDGDRDVLPLIVGEALSMEVPVVASAIVGLPEVVRLPWGRLVPPGDPDALAAALDEVLSLAPEERAAAGRAGREFVVRTRDIDREAERLVGLIRQTTGVR
jgi:glycosyltransferase involved in cell wall biosynthesis